MFVVDPTGWHETVKSFRNPFLRLFLSQTDKTRLGLVGHRASVVFPFFTSCRSQVEKRQTLPICFIELSRRVSSTHPSVDLVVKQVASGGEWRGQGCIEELVAFVSQLWMFLFARKGEKIIWNEKRDSKILPCPLGFSLNLPSLAVGAFLITAAATSWGLGVNSCQR